MAEEGWYSDPYRIHEQRWFSDGTPTNLVRDQRRKSHDDPPQTPYVEEPRPIESAQSVAADDLRRSDDQEPSALDPVDAAWTIFTRSSGL